LAGVLPKAWWILLKQAGQSFGKWRRSWQENARLLFQCSREASVWVVKGLTRIEVSGLNVENKVGQTKAPGQSFSVRWQAFWVTASLGAAFACCASEAGHNTQKPRLAGEVRLASMAAGRNCYILAGRRLWKDPQILPTLRRGTLAPVRSTAIWFWRRFWKLWRGLVVGVVGNGEWFGW
jgi:hypothetical protein